MFNESAKRSFVQRNVMLPVLIAVLASSEFPLYFTIVSIAKGISGLRQWQALVSVPAPVGYAYVDALIQR